MSRLYLQTNVLEEAKERISFTFDEFEKIYVSFSGGKDSTVMTHLVLEEAIKRNRKVGLFFLDWECQFNLTINHIKEIYKQYWDYIIPYWVSIPIETDNACSQTEPVWVSWEEGKEDIWVRQKEKISINDAKFFPFYYKNITFEEFTPLFAQWFSEGEPCACFVGIRTVESLNRYRTIARNDKPCYKDKRWTTNVVDDIWNIYPIYDWCVDDIWRYNGKLKKPYNQLYDRMYQAGLTISQMRVDEPFGDTTRRSLWLYQIIEPDMWTKITARIAGANSGSLYSHESGNILGNSKISLPKGHTWESFSLFLLKTMPPKTAEHYKNKIAVYIKWYMKRGYENGIPDFGDYKLEQKGIIPSWRRVCKTLLRNDYYCKGLGFSVTKSKAYQKYQELMKRRRNEWKIFPTEKS
jgi:predicted phosphoadenosine phosphosulfate sulfurtransferase